MEGYTGQNSLVIDRSRLLGPDCRPLTDPQSPRFENAGASELAAEGHALLRISSGRLLITDPIYLGDYYNENGPDVQYMKKHGALLNDFGGDVGGYIFRTRCGGIKVDMILGPEDLENPEGNWSVSTAALRSAQIPANPLGCDSGSYIFLDYTPELRRLFAQKILRLEERRHLVVVNMGRGLYGVGYEQWPADPRNGYDSFTRNLVVYPIDPPCHPEFARKIREVPPRGPGAPPEPRPQDVKEFFLSMQDSGKLGPYSVSFESDGSVQIRAKKPPPTIRERFSHYLSNVGILLGVFRLIAVAAISAFSLANAARNGHLTTTIPAVFAPFLLAYLVRGAMVGQARFFLRLVNLLAFLCCIALVASPLQQRLAEPAWMNGMIVFGSLLWGVHFWILSDPDVSKAKRS